MSSFRLAEVSGFEIRIDASWFIIFFLILWTLSQGLFPASFPGLSTGVYLAMGIAGTLLFFSSLLVHELSHSVVARAKGIPVEGITLFLFGGMARTRMEAETPGDEFQIAGVGPLTSIALGGLFYLVAWWGARAGWSEAVVGVADYLGEINIVLAVFNLLPGFPLDGGRLFRSAVWKFTGSLEKATRWATRGGQGVGYLLMALGVLLVFQGSLLGGIWMALIGYFLYNAARGQLRLFRVEHLLDGVPARAAMTPSPETVPPDWTIRRLVSDRFLRRRFQAYPVVEDGHIRGIIDLQQVRDLPEEQWNDRTVASVMTPVSEDMLAAPDTPLPQAMERMQAAPGRRVLIARDGQLLGILTPSDVAWWVQRTQQLGRR